MTEKIISEGRDLIISFEQGPGGGPALTPYLCPAGVLTIGYGRTKGVKPGDRLPSKVYAEIMLDEDLLAYAAEVDELVGSAPTSQHERAALTSLNYNIGKGNFAKSTVLRLHKSGDKAGAARAFAMWKLATDPKTGKMVEMPGLVRRRAAETALYLTPDAAGHVERVPAMPQAVAKPKGAMTSKTVIGAAVSGVSVTTILAENVQPAVDAAHAAVQAAEQAKTVASSVGDLLGAFSNGHVLTVALLALALGCIAFVGIRYVLKMRAGDVVAK